MGWQYDEGNVFARILRGEIPNDTVMETEHVLAFRDIRPQAPVHVLVIPKGPYVDAVHFGAAASEAEIVAFARAVSEVARMTGATTEGGGPGFRVLSNGGAHGVQEVPHYHVHLFGGRDLGRILAPA